MPCARGRWELLMDVVPRTNSFRFKSGTVVALNTAFTHYTRSLTIDSRSNYHTPLPRRPGQSRLTTDTQSARDRKQLALIHGSSADWQRSLDREIRYWTYPIRKGE